MFDEIIKNIVGNILKGSILVFDLGYYDSERFKTLDKKCILFFTRIKSNIKYEIIDIEGKSKIIRLVSNGYTLRLVSIKKVRKDYGYLTNIYFLYSPEIFKYWNLIKKSYGHK